MDISRWASVFKKAVVILILLILLMPAINGASAQTSGGIKIEVQAGLDGGCKLNTWLPVRVTVENTGTDIEARVQVSYQNDHGGNSAYAMDISLPATSRKEFFLYANLTGQPRSFNVSVLEGSTQIAKKDLNVLCSGAEDLYFGVLADDPSPYAVLRDIRALSGGRTHLAQLTVADLPDRVQGWSALDALIVSNVDTGKLSADQKQAMQLWIANGGRLFVTGGIHWQMTAAGLQDVMPVGISSTKNVMNLSALSEYIKDADPLEGGAVLASGKLLDGAHLLVAQGNIPLLVEKRIGYGKVFYFAADPGLQPLNSWVGMENVYEHLLAFKPQKPAWANASWDSNSANDALSALPELDMPSFLYICCWLGVYVLVIGPVNYLVLRRLKRTELAWITVPVLVIMFSCLAYVFGFAYRGFTPVLNRLALVQGWDGVPQARVNDLVGIYSPSRTSYTVQTQDQFMLYEPYGMSSDLQGGNDRLQFKNDSGTSLPDVHVEIGGMVTTAAEGYMPVLKIQDDLTLVLGQGVSRLIGTITNTSGYTLRDAVLITPGEWYLLKSDLKPNESVKISRSIVPSSSANDVYNLLSSLGLPYYSYSNADKDLARRSSFLRASISSHNSQIVNVSGIYLMGWLDDVPAPVNLQGQGSDTVDTMLYFQKLTPAVKTSSQSFNLSSVAYEWESSIGTLTPPQVPTDGYEIRFQLGESVDFSTVKSLRLEITSNSSSAHRMHVSAWNFETKTWDDVPPPWSGYTFVSNPSLYVGVDGEIRLRIEADQNDYIQLDTINFTLEVTP